MHECIPSGTIPSRRNRAWLTKILIQAIRRRNAPFKRVKTTGDYTAYKHYRNKVVSYLRSAKFAYFKNLNPMKTKEFWKICKLLNKTASSIPTLTTPGTTAHSDLQKAELLNSFFTTCLNRSRTPLDVLEHQALPCSGEFPNSLLCTEDSVFDNVSALMLKRTAASIAPSITQLFNQSLQLGKIPSDWKLSHIVPIPKVSPAKSGRMTTCNWNSNYSELQSIVNLPTLEKRRLELKLGHLFNIVHTLCFFPNNIIRAREQT